MSEPAPPSADHELPHWLAAQWARYRAEPSEATRLLPSALAAFDARQAAPPSPGGVELGLLIGVLASEQRDPDSVFPVLRQALACCEAGVAGEFLVELLCLHGRADIQAQRYESAGPLLNRAHALALQRRDLQGQGLAEIGLAQLAHRLGDMPRTVALTGSAIERLRPIGSRQPWVQAYAIRAVAQRELRDAAGRRDTLLEGIAVAEAQRRWGEAVNLVSGLIDMDLEAGDTAAAERRLAGCEDMLARAGTCQQPMGLTMLRFSRARCHAARGRFQQACIEMRAALAWQEVRLAAHEFARRLEQLADWLARAGEAQEALAATRKAHQLMLAHNRDAAQRDERLLRQRLALDQAEVQRQTAEAHARELAAQNQALDQALQRQRELQAELIENSKLVSLGHLLAGVAHELNTPLGSALDALSGALERSQGMRNSVDSGAISRSRLLADLIAAVAGGEQAQGQLQRALELVAGYKELQAQELPPPPVLQRLDLLVLSAWQRVLAPDAGLQLQLDAELELRLPAEALVDVLVQLFQNVERHAYAPGEAGLVQVSGHLREGHVLLTVSDAGRGIATELLPRIFDPYVSTQFGHGRSGLGLFVARAAVKHRLGGRIRAFSQVGAGSRFEIDWPQG